VLFRLPRCRRGSQESNPAPSGFAYSPCRGVPPHRLRPWIFAGDARGWCARFSDRGASTICAAQSSPRSMFFAGKRGCHTITATESVLSVFARPQAATAIRRGSTGSSRRSSSEAVQRQHPRFIQPSQWRTSEQNASSCIGGPR
jgi:hypothetical protein